MTGNLIASPGLGLNTGIGMAMDADGIVIYFLVVAYTYLHSHLIP